MLLDQGKYDGSLEHAIEAYKMGIKKKNAKLILDSINLQGLIHWRIGDPNKLENVVREGMILVSNLTEAEEAEIGGSEGDLYNLDGLLAWNRGNFDTAIKWHKSALAIRQKLNDDYAIAVSLNNLGIVYLAQGNLVDALENITKSVSLWQKKQNKRVMAYSYKNLGIIYSGLK
ncbi:MAG: tetratricopeptide repeat protein, partial [Candidatus Heimdallarchaeota archaeon]|nr:tetratricopeptide repeat protein [Candidatus Heimdallarchaeota archaeon]